MTIPDRKKETPPVFHEILVPMELASAFAAEMRVRLGDEVYDRVSAARLAYRDGVMLVPDDWAAEAASIDLGGLNVSGEGGA